MERMAMKVFIFVFLIKKIIYLVIYLLFFGLLPNISYHISLIDVIHASTIVANHIKTKSLEVGCFVIGNTIQTHQGDIAYHFPISDSDELFKEGEIVGLFPDKVENKMNITKLTADTASAASLKGVITRSQYLEARKPLDPKGVLFVKTYEYSKATL